MNFIDKIIGKKYTKEELQSFSAMNIILAFVLFFFAFHGLGFLTASNYKKPPHKLEEMQVLEGKILKLHKEKVRKEDKRPLEFLDKNGVIHNLYFVTGAYHSYNDYIGIIGTDIRIWFPTTEPYTKELEQIQYLSNNQYFMEYKYNERMDGYRHITSDYYKNTYKKWGGGALALLILQIILTILIKRRRNVILDGNR